MLFMNADEESQISIEIWLFQTNNKSMNKIQCSLKTR